MNKVFLVTGWCSDFVEPGFEYEFATLEEAKRKAIELLERRAQTTLRIYEAVPVSRGRRGTSDKSYVFESKK